MKKTKLLAFLLIAMLAFNGYTQINNICSNSLQTCLETPTILAAGISAGSAGDYVACISTTPNPVWFNFKVQQSGRINIAISSNPSHDLDFACWGPFSADNVLDLNNSNYCSLLKIDTLSASHGPDFGSNPTSFGGYPIGNLVDCSYSDGANEYIHIPNALAGEWYLILVTNYSNQAANINMLTDTSSAGLSDCVLSMPILYVNQSVMNGFNYYSGSGPSLAQSFNLSGIHLLDYPSNITVYSSVNYEISLNSDTGFTSNFAIPYTADSLPPLPIYARLKAGLAVNDYNNQIIQITGGGVDSMTIQCSGSVLSNNAVPENLESRRLVISPIPASEVLTCAFDLVKSRKLSIVDLLGKTIVSWESNLQNETIDVRALLNGIYFLKVEEENQSYSRKFIIRKD